MRRLITALLILISVASYAQQTNTTNTNFINGLASSKFLNIPRGTVQPTVGLISGSLFYHTTLGLQYFDGTIWQTVGTSGDGVTSFNGRVGVVVPLIGDYSAFYVPLTRTLTINGVSYDLSVNRTFNVGTVTSVAGISGTGISITGSPITTSGSLTITNTAPDQVVSLTAGSGIATSGTYPNFTITNTSPSDGGVTTMAPIGTVANADGATISGNTLTLQPASGGYGGVLTTTGQYIAGEKTFTSSILSYGELKLLLPAQTTAINMTTVGGLGRWLVGNSTAETGVGNTGYDYSISGRSDGGVLLGEWLKIKRSNGMVTLSSDAVINSLTVGRGSGGVISNTTTGNQALASNSTGAFNTATGAYALNANTTGSVNTANGYGSLFSNVTGIENTGVGYRSLFSNTGSYNTGVGSNSLNDNTTGEYNTAIGSVSLYSNTTGANNTALGASTLQNNTVGNYNTAVGRSSLYTNINGSENTAVGNAALTLTTSSYNTAIGGSSLGVNTTGNSNTAIGQNSLYSNTTANNNTAIGQNALRNSTTGGDNTATGQSALYNNTTGYSNSANGMQALTINTEGYLNTANGYQALYGNTTGIHNTATGAVSLQFITTGTNNTAVGYNSGNGIITGSRNTIVGANVTGLASALSNNIILSDGAGSIKAQHDGTNWNMQGNVTAPTFIGNLTAGTGSFSGIATAQTAPDGSVDNQIATTQFVFNATNTRRKEAAKYGSTGALPSSTYNNGSSGFGATLTGVALGAITMDGFSPAVSDRLLIKNQASGFQNGIYVVTATGSAIASFVLTRSSDFNSSIEIKSGDAIFITAGTTLNSTTWAYNGVSDPVLGTTNITFAQSGGPGVMIGGNGITVTGPSIAIDVAVVVDRSTTQTIGGAKTFSSDLVVNSLNVGRGLGNSILNSTLGATSLQGNTTGTNNTSVGNSSLFGNTTGSGNSSFGSQALYSNTTGSNNTALGYNTGIGIGTGTGNTVLGANVTGLATALTNNIIIANGTGSIKAQHDGSTWAFGTDMTVNGITVGKGTANVTTNTVIGLSALAGNTSGSNITTSGYQSMQGNTTGANSTATGANSLQGNTTGSGNSVFGSQAATTNTSGGNNSIFGYNTGTGITTGTGNTILGANVTGLTAALTNNIILANGVGTVKAQHDGTNWTFTGGIVSPSLTGTPIAPTAAALTSTTQIATTAFVTAGIAASGANYLPLTAGSGQSLTGTLYVTRNAASATIPTAGAILQNTTAGANSISPPLAFLSTHTSSAVMGNRMYSNLGTFVIQKTSDNTTWDNMLSSNGVTTSLYASATRVANLSLSQVTANRTYTFPDVDGQLITNPMTTAGDIIYGGSVVAGVAAPTRLAGVATGNALISGGVGTASSWGKIALTTHVSGILPVANGGTGSSAQNFVDLTTAQTVAGVKTLASPTLTGIPIAPTAAAGTNTTQLATTAFVTAGLATKEAALTFSTGLTRTTNTITNDLSTGIAGFQTVIGSTSTNTGLILQATSANGVTDADIIFKVGNNGSKTPMRIVNNSSIVVGSTNPNALFDRSFTIVNDAATSPLPTRAGYADFKLSTYNNGVNTKFSNLQISTNRGTEAASTFPLSGDLIGSVYFGSNSPGTDAFYSGPIVQAYATENWALGTNRGSKLVLGSGVQGSWVGQDVMVIGSNTNVGIGNLTIESNYKLGVMGGDLGVGNNTPSTFSGFRTISVGEDSGGSIGGIFSTRYNGTDAIRMIGTGTGSVLNEPRNLPIEIRTNGVAGLTQLANQTVTSVGTITAPTFLGSLLGNTVTANNYVRSLSWVPSFTGVTGSSVEMFYITGDDAGRVQAYDRTNSLLKPLVFNGSVITMFPLVGAGTRMVVANPSGDLSTQAIPGGGGGSVTGVAVASANGLAGTSDGAAVVPTLTLRTTINSPVLAGNGTAISAATATGTGSTVVMSVSPALTGTPTATTATVGTNTTQLATTAFVQLNSGRQLEEWYTNVSNSGSTQTDLSTFSVPGNTLVNDGDKLAFSLSGSYAANSNAKNLSIVFGSAWSPFTSTNNGGYWQISGYLIKVSSTTYRISVSKNDGTTSGVIAGTGTVPSFTSANTFKLTGTGASTSDIIAESGYLEFKPAAL